MFSFAGDTVLEPCMGTAMTLLASARCGRHGIGVEIEPAYVRMSKERIERQLTTCFRPATLARGMSGFSILDDDAAAIGMVCPSDEQGGAMVPSIVGLSGWSAAMADPSSRLSPAAPADSP
jgi:hypothetical protein